MQIEAKKVNEVDLIKEASRHYNEKTAIVADKNAFFDVANPSAFFAGMYRYCSSQQYGMRIPRYLSDRLGSLTPTSSRDSIGDYVSDISGAKIEFKTTFKSAANSTYNVVQVRLYEPLDLFFVCAIDPSDSFKYNLFLLNKNEMAYEVNREGSSAHIPNKMQKVNMYREYRMTLSPKTFKRWQSNYSYETLTDVYNAIANFKRFYVKING